MALRWGRAAGGNCSLHSYEGVSSLASSGSAPVEWVEIEPEVGAVHDRSFEGRLRSGEIDVAFWDMRRVSTEIGRSIIVAGVPVRSAPWDAWVGASIEALAEGAEVAVVSPFQQMRVKAMRADLRARLFRGDEQGARGALREDVVGAAVVSVVSLKSTPDESERVRELGLEEMVPAPGQGAMALVCRADDRHTMDLLEALHDPDTARSVSVERTFFRSLDPALRSLCGAHAWREGHHLVAEACRVSHDGLHRVRLRADLLHGFALGRALAVQLTEMG